MLKYFLCSKFGLSSLFLSFIFENSIINLWFLYHSLKIGSLVGVNGTISLKDISKLPISHTSVYLSRFLSFSSSV